MEPQGKMRNNWRGSKEWKEEGLNLTTGSESACKMFDAALTQYVGWYEDDNLGGLEKTVAEIIAADADFVMGHVMSVGLQLLATGSTIRLDKQLEQDLRHVVQLSEKQKSLSDREKNHVTACKLFADGYLKEAVDVWECILLKNPMDMLATKFAQDSYFYLGQQRQMRDSIARVLPLWKPSTPLYSYLHGMYAFGLVETNFFNQAEITARKGLHMHSTDAWATHALAHVFEMERRPEEGIAFLGTTISDWEKCGLLACHNFWHWALYHIEKGEYDAAIDIFDAEVGKRMLSGAMLDIVDATSLLYRLNMEGISVGKRWTDVFDICRPHTDDHILTFNDVHILMACLGAKKKEATKQLMQSLEEFIRNGKGTNHDVMNAVGYQLCEAFVAADEENFAKAVDIILPIRYDIIKIGGSDAQRDLFNIFLISSAVKSNMKAHQELARHLLLERKMFNNSSLTDRLGIQLLTNHFDQ